MRVREREREEGNPDKFARRARVPQERKRRVRQRKGGRADERRREYERERATALGEREGEGGCRRGGRMMTVKGRGTRGGQRRVGGTDPDGVVARAAGKRRE